MLTDASHFIYSVDDSPHPPAIQVEVLVRWRSLKMKKQTCETCLSVMSWIFLDCIKSKGGLWEWLWFAGQDPRRLWSPSAVLGGSRAGRRDVPVLAPHCSLTKRWAPWTKPCVCSEGRFSGGDRAAMDLLCFGVMGTSRLFLWHCQTCSVYNFSLFPLLLSPSDKITSKYVVCVFWLGC